MSSVSVILTFYNNRDFVESALSQIQALDYQDFQLIVIDDCSKDGTRELLATRESKFEGATFLYNDRNLGVARSRNRAVAHSSGEYIWFVDCDDAWEPDILSTLLSAVDATRSDIAIGGAIRVTSATRTTGTELDGHIAGTFQGEDAERLLLTGGIRGYLWNKLIRRDLLVRFPFPELTSQSDLACVIQMVFSQARVTILDKVVYRHVERMGSITNKKIESLANMEFCLKLIEEHAKTQDGIADELVYFRQWAHRTSIVNTTIRLGTSDPLVRERARELRKASSFRELAIVARYSKREALIALLMRVSGPAYPAIYRGYAKLSRLG